MARRFRAKLWGRDGALQGLDVRLATKGLLPDARVAAWIAETALRIANRR